MDQGNFLTNETPLSTDYYYEANHTYQNYTPYCNSHSHNYYEIFIVLLGEIQFMIKDNIYNVYKGDIVMIPPFYTHSIIPINTKYKFEVQCLWITANCISTFQFNEYSLLKPLQDSEKFGIFRYHIDDEEDFLIINTSIDKIRASKQHNLYGKELMNRSYIIQSFTIINRYIAKEVMNLSTDRINPMASQIIAFINKNFTDDLSLELLCEKFYTNKRTLSQTFKEYTTITLHNYLIKTRISHAKQLICSGILPSKVHTMCGFNNYTTFYRAFQKVEGISPKQFYENCQKQLM